MLNLINLQIKMELITSVVTRISSICEVLKSDPSMDLFFRVNVADTERREYTAEIDQLKTRYTIQLMLSFSIFCGQFGFIYFFPFYPSV